MTGAVPFPATAWLASGRGARLPKQARPARYAVTHWLVMPRDAVRPASGRYVDFPDSCREFEFEPAHAPAHATSHRGGVPVPPRATQIFHPHFPTPSPPTPRSG